MKITRNIVSSRQNKRIQWLQYLQCIHKMRVPKQAVFHIIGAIHTGELRVSLEGELKKMIMSIIN
jgi:hypothetical protein